MLAVLRRELTGRAPAPDALAVLADPVFRGAGFSMPVQKYYVSNSGAAPAAIAASTLLLLRPDDQATLTASKVVDFTWSVIEGAATYRFEVEDLQNSPVISAILPVGVGTYRTPPWFKDRVGSTVVRWRVIAFDQENRAIATTDWRGLRLANQ